MPLPPASSSTGVSSPLASASAPKGSPIDSTSPTRAWSARDAGSTAHPGTAFTVIAKRPPGSGRRAVAATQPGGRRSPHRPSGAGPARACGCGGWRPAPGSRCRPPPLSRARTRARGRRRDHVGETRSGPEVENVIGGRGRSRRAPAVNVSGSGAGDERTCHPLYASAYRCLYSLYIHFRGYHAGLFLEPPALTDALPPDTEARACPQDRASPATTCWLRPCA